MEFNSKCWGAGSLRKLQSGLSRTATGIRNNVLGVYQVKQMYTPQELAIFEEAERLLKQGKSRIEHAKEKAVRLEREKEQRSKAREARVRRYVAKAIDIHSLEPVALAKTLLIFADRGNGRHNLAYSVGYILEMMDENDHGFLFNLREIREDIEKYLLKVGDTAWRYNYDSNDYIQVAEPEELIKAEIDALNESAMSGIECRYPHHVKAITERNRLYNIKQNRESFKIVK